MLARVAVIALGAVLLLLTGVLFVQVGEGPRQHGAGDDGSVSSATPRRTAEERDEGAPSSASSASSAPASAPSGASENRTEPAPPPVDPSSPAAISAAANLQFDEANKLYDRREYEDARFLALHLLREHSTSVRMRRVVVASSCIMGDNELAQQHYLFLPAKDRADMRERCTTYGLIFREQ